MKPTEQQLAAKVVAYLESAGHDVYQEVEYRGVVIDIVALAGPEVWAVETKTSWSLELLEQCVQRKRAVHRVFAAVPRGRSEHVELFRGCGVGSLVVTMDPVWGPAVETRFFPPRTTARRDWPRDLKAKLGVGHKTHAKAGAPSGAGRWTPFLETCERLRYAAQGTPGITLKAAIEGMKHHYSSDAVARGSIVKWIERGKIPGVRLEREGRVVRIFVANEEAPTEAPLVGSTS